MSSRMTRTIDSKAKPRRSTRGSVLMPVVAAMLILALVGVSLAELFSAQRMSSVHGIDSTRAYWAAEAGIWHAAFEQADITTPVSYAGATYTVSKSGDTYTATAVCGSTTTVLSLTLAGGGS